jgi:uncharacterized SAM-binding protein YcdF (DUF218 family)
MGPLDLLSFILVWAAVGLFLWYLFTQIIPKNFLTIFGMGVLLALIFASFLFPTDDTIGTIWRVISFPLTPLGFVITTLALSFKQISFKDGFKNNGQWVAIALIVLFISSLPIFARLLVNQAEQSVQEAYNQQRGICQDVCPATIPESAPLSRIVGLVVMGEPMDFVYSPIELASRVEGSPNLTRAASLSPTLLSRLDSATRLYNEVVATGAPPPFVMLTMGPIKGGTEAQGEKQAILREVMAARGIPTGEGSLIITRDGMNARATVEAIQEELDERGIITGEDINQLDASRIALVAPGITMRRSALAFEDEEIEVVAWPTNLYGSAIDTEDELALLSDLVPSVEALRLTTAYWNEFLTSVYYFLRGWMPDVDLRWSEIVELVPQ